MYVDFKYFGFIECLELTVDVPGYGQITVDIVYAGAFYALVPAGQYGLDIRESGVPALREAAGVTTGPRIMTISRSILLC